MHMHTHVTPPCRRDMVCCVRIHTEESCRFAADLRRDAAEKERITADAAELFSGHHQRCTPTPDVATSMARGGARVIEQIDVSTPTKNGHVGSLTRESCCCWRAVLVAEAAGNLSTLAHERKTARE